LNRENHDTYLYQLRIDRIIWKIDDNNILDYRKGAILNLKELKQLVKKGETMRPLIFGALLSEEVNEGCE
jgi:hypothetical protein